MRNYVNVYVSVAVLDFIKFASIAKLQLLEFFVLYTFW